MEEKFTYQEVCFFHVRIVQAEHDHGQQPRGGAGAGQDSGDGQPGAAARQQEVHLLRHGQECRDRHQLAAKIERLQ